MLESKENNDQKCQSSRVSACVRAQGPWPPDFSRPKEEFLPLPLLLQVDYYCYHHWNGLVVLICFKGGTFMVTRSWQVRHLSLSLVIKK